MAAVLVVAGALTSFPVAYESTSGDIARAGFAAQGAVWLALIVAGVAAIRRKARARHARLMMAMAAVASGAIWVRLTTSVATGWDLPFHAVYACATWLGWLVPLALVWTATRISVSGSRAAPLLPIPSRAEGLASQTIRL